MRNDYKYEDGRNGFLFLPEAGEKLVNEYLEEEFETASMFFIHSRHQAEGEGSLDSAIIDFFDKLGTPVDSSYFFQLIVDNKL